MAVGRFETGPYNRVNPRHSRENGNLRALSRAVT